MNEKPIKQDALKLPGVPSIQDLYPDTFDCDEEAYFEQCDFPALNLGTESLAATPRETSTFTLGAVPRIKWKGQKSKQGKVKKAADRDCMICVEHAQRPSRTRCCGKLFCESHLFEWLARSSNQCPGCAAYCHPETGVISLAPPTSPTVSSQLPNTYFPKTDKSPRSHSPSSSSSSSSCSSVDDISDQDDEDNHDQIANRSSFSLFHLRSFLVKLIRMFLDDSSLEMPYRPENYQSTLPPPSQSLILAPPSSQSHDFQMFFTPSYRSSGSEVVEEEPVLALASSAGKVLSIVALILVFWVLTS